MPRTSFDGRTAVITGAASGMGRALALDLAARGCRLALSDQDAEGVEKVAALAQERGALEVLTTTLDVRDQDAVRAHAAQVAGDLGDVHLMVNNAGVALFANALEQSREDAQWIMDVDFWGVVNGTEAFLPLLIAAGTPDRPGRLVNVSSLFGLIAMPTQSAYNAAKFAVRGYTEALAMELDLQGVAATASCVHPGGVRTGIARAARYAPGSDVERLTRFFDDKLATMAPERAAQIILRGAERGDRRIIVGADALGIHLAQQLLGAGYQRLIGGVARRVLASQAPQMLDAHASRPDEVAS